MIEIMLHNLFTAYAQAPIDPEAADFSGLETVVSNFLGLATALGGMLAVVMLFIGGFKYITSRGDPKGVDAARNTITWAIVGLVLIVVAYLVLRLIRDFTGVDVTIFRIRPEN